MNDFDKKVEKLLMQAERAGCQDMTNGEIFRYLSALCSESTVIDKAIQIINDRRLEAELYNELESEDKNGGT